MNVMFDTNIFDHVVKKQIDISNLQGRVTIYATSIQYRELSDTPKNSHRQALLQLFNEITNVRPTESGIIGISAIGEAKVARNVIPTESAVWDVSDWDEAKWSEEGGLCEKIWEALDKRNGGKENNPKDALIAETAIVNNMTLVTHDADLFSVVSEDFKAAAISLRDLLQGVFLGVLAQS